MLTAVLADKGLLVVRIRHNLDSAINPLMLLLSNPDQPAIARATSAESLAPLLTDVNVFEALQQALKDPSPLVRSTSARVFYDLPARQKIDALAPLLSDSIRSVRIAAAHSLTGVPSMQLEVRDRKALINATEEYKQSLIINSDFVSANHQQAIDWEKLGNASQAEAHYQKALKIDKHSNASRMNLAHLKYRQQQYSEAEALYRKVIAQEPKAAPALYALGLLLAEQGQITQAESFLLSAAQNKAGARAWYNLAVLRQQNNNPDNTLKAYQQALSLEPTNHQFLLGLASLCSQQHRWQLALEALDQALTLDPTNSANQRLKHHLLKATP